MPVSLRSLLENKTSLRTYCRDYLRLSNAQYILVLFCLLNYTAIIAECFVGGVGVGYLSCTCLTEPECEVVTTATAAAAESTEAGIRTLELEELAEHLLGINVT